MANPNDRNVVLEDVRIIFRNFAGLEGQYNRAGDRNFSVVLDEQQAEDLRAKGFNVKTKPPREEGDEPLHHLSVAVSFKGRPPRLVMITSKGRTTLGEDECELLDWADLKTVDLIINPYQWAVSGKTGTKAYLHAIYAIIMEDELEQKYSEVPEIGANSRPALTSGQDADIIDGEIVDEYEDRPALPRGK